MDRTISATVIAPPASTMSALADLGTYPEWLTLVTAAEPDGDDAWLVTLRARLGPLARSKRLRMRRTHVDETSVTFERAETDGRTHADWILSANLTPVDDRRCDVEVHLHYGGALWSAPLELALAAYEGNAAEGLSTFLTESAE